MRVSNRSQLPFRTGVRPSVRRSVPGWKRNKKIASLEEYSTRLNRIQLTRCSVVQHSSRVLSEMAEEVEFLCSWLKSGSVSWESNCLVYISTCRTENQRKTNTTTQSKQTRKRKEKAWTRTTCVARRRWELRAPPPRGRHRPAAVLAADHRFCLNYNPSDRRQCVLKCWAYVVDICSVFFRSECM